MTCTRALRCTNDHVHINLDPLRDYVYSRACPVGQQYICISRVLHLLGFIAHGLTIVGLNWQATTPTRRQLGVRPHLCPDRAGLQDRACSIWIRLPNTGIVVVWFVVTISLCLSFYVLYLGTKVCMRFVWGGMFRTWIMLAVYDGVLLTVNPTIIGNGMKLVQNIDYQMVLAKAQELGWQRGAISVAATVMAGITFMNLTCLGSTYSANIAGEIKRVDRAQPLAQYGSIILFIIYYQIFTYVTYHGFGKDLMEAISKLNAAGADKEIFGSFPQTFRWCMPRKTRSCC